MSTPTSSPTTTFPPPLHAPVPWRPRPRVRLTAARAAAYARHLSALLVFAAVATALTYRAGAGLNVPLVCGGLVGLSFYRACGRTNWRALLAAPTVRYQLSAWLAIAGATVAHFDDWTTVSLLLATAVLSGALLSGAPDPFRGLVRGLGYVAGTVVGYVEAWRLALRWGRFRVGTGPALDGGRWAVPLAGTLAFAGLYVASSEALTDAWAAAVAWVTAGAFWGDVFGVLLVAAVWTFVGAGFLFGPRRLRGVLRGSFGESLPVVGEESDVWSRASLTLAMVNALALVLNVTDVFTTWLAEPSASGTVLKRGVHEGTWTLVTAILAAAAVMGYAFRQNPPDATRAKRLALAWLAQNGAMALTVALRNYHYVDAYGLTYKRVGVYLFLVCAAAGLYLLGRKVWRGEGFEALVRRQAWMVYAVLATAALANWPGLITRYNLSEARREVDAAYLRGLQPYNVPVRAELDPSWLTSYNGPISRKYPAWNDAPEDWRDWDYGEWQRARLAAPRDLKSEQR